MITATLSSRNQITIPKALLELLAIKSGDKLVIETKDEAIRLKPAGSSLVKSLGGSVKVGEAQKKASLEKIMSITQKRVAQRLVNES